LFSSLIIATKAKLECRSNNTKWKIVVIKKCCSTAELISLSSATDSAENDKFDEKCAWDVGGCGTRRVKKMKKGMRLKKIMIFEKSPF